MKEPKAYIIASGIDGNLLDFLNLIDGFINDMPDDYLMISSIHAAIELSVYIPDTNEEFTGAKALKTIIDLRRKQMGLWK